MRDTTRESSRRLISQKTHAHTVVFVCSVRLEYSDLHRRGFILGAAMVTIAMVDLFWSMLGPSGGLFVAHLVTYPMAVFGGILIGYAAVPMVLEIESRLPRIAFALIAAGLAFTGQLFLFAVMNPGINIAEDWLDLSRTWYPIFIAVVSVVIGSYEVGREVNSRLALFP